MTIKGVTYYVAECDGCGMRAEYGDFTAMSDPGEAEYLPEWSGGAGRHHCPLCPPLCEGCGAEAGEDAADRDDLCQACFDKAAAAEAVTR